MPLPRPWKPGRPLAATRLAGTRPTAMALADLRFTLDAPRWHEHARCRDTDPDAFFPEDGPATRASLVTAKRICRECPVRDECLGYALDHPEVVGVWGGLTTNERRRLNPHRRPRARPQDAEIARLTRAGLSAERIAAQLGVSSRTVHRARHRQRHLEEAA